MFKKRQVTKLSNFWKIYSHSFSSCAACRRATADGNFQPSASNVLLSLWSSSSSSSSSPTTKKSSSSKITNGVFDQCVGAAGHGAAALPNRGTTLTACEFWQIQLEWAPYVCPVPEAAPHTHAPPWQHPARPRLEYPLWVSLAAARGDAAAERAVLSLVSVVCLVAFWGYSRETNHILNKQPLLKNHVSSLNTVQCIPQNVHSRPCWSCFSFVHHVQIIGFVCKGEEGAMLLKMEHSETSHSSQGEETKTGKFLQNILFCPHLMPAFFVYPSLSLEPHSSLSIIPGKQRTCQSFPFQ